MRNDRLSLAETYGLALMGAVRGVGEAIVLEANDKLHKRQVKVAPELGQVVLMEESNHDLPKAA